MSTLFTNVLAACLCSVVTLTNFLKSRIHMVLVVANRWIRRLTAIEDSGSKQVIRIVDEVTNVSMTALQK